MGVNKVEINGEAILDLTGDSVTEETLAYGETAHNAAGEPIVGRMVGNEGFADTGDFIMHFKCTPEYLVEGTENLYWVYDPCDMTPADYVSMYESGRPLKVKAEIPMEDGSTLTVVAPFAGENSTNPGEMAYVVVYDQIEYKFTVVYRKAGDDVDGYPYYLICIEFHDPVGYASTGNLTTYLSSASTDDQFPSAKAVVDYIEDVGLGGGGDSNTFTFDFVYADGVVSLPTGVTYSSLLDKFKAGVHIVGCLDVPITAGANFGTYFLPMCYGTDLAGFLVFTAWKNNVRVNVQITSAGSLTWEVTPISTSITANSTHFEFPSAKAVHDYVKANAGGGGGTAVQEVAYIYGTFEMATMSYSTDTTFAEIMSMVDNGKYVVAKSTITFGGTPTNITWMPLTAIDPSSVAVFEGTMQADLSALNPAYKLVLLAISVEICPDGTIYTRVRVVSTTNLN